MPETIWKCQPFDELSTVELYKILELRNKVFIVEQNCVYQDCDRKDFKAYHLTAWQGTELVAYTRLFPIGVYFQNAASIGRVITATSARRQRIGTKLLENSIEHIYSLFGKSIIKISAQLYLKSFYELFLFKQVSEVYLEDGIDHIAMEKEV